MKVTEILRKFLQYEDFHYANDLNCPYCDKSGFFPSGQKEKPIIIGWCETNIGYMGVFECPVCGQKFRFHCTVSTWNADLREFDHYLYFYAKRCANFEEIKKRL